MPRTYSHLSYEQRLRVKELLDKGTKKVDIARALGVHNATIYREIDRGSINGIYDPGHAEEQYRGHLSEKGRPTICSISPELAQHIAMLILEEKLSPAKIIDRLQEEKWSTAPKARATIYSAIDGGLIPGVIRSSSRKALQCNGLIGIAQIFGILKKNLGRLAAQDSRGFLR